MLWLKMAAIDKRHHRVRWRGSRKWDYCCATFEEYTLSSGNEKKFGQNSINYFRMAQHIFVIDGLHSSTFFTQHCVMLHSNFNGKNGERQNCRIVLRVVIFTHKFVLLAFCFQLNLQAIFLDWERRIRISFYIVDMFNAAFLAVVLNTIFF